MSKTTATPTLLEQRKGYGLLEGGGRCVQPFWRPGQRFHHLFEDVVDDMPNAAHSIAVEFSNVKHSFEDLEAFSNRLARLLQARGVARGDRVALLFDRTMHTYASQLAISKVGAAFVPLDVGFPSDRIDFILADAGVTVVLTMSFFAPLFDGSACPILALDVADDDIAAHSSDRLIDGPASQADDGLAYIIYTSGTTGRPKGVQLQHSGIVNFLYVARDNYGFRDDDRVFQSLSMAFDYSFEEIWVPLLSGSRLVPAPAGVNLLGSDLADFLRVNRITAYCSVPTVLSTIEDDLPDLRLLIASGEACPPHLCERWLKNGRRFLNLYGPTETTVSATWSIMEPGNPVTIGKPLPTYTVAILDPDAPRILEPGETGELVIAGIGVSPGYLNRAEATEKAFIPDFIGIANNPTGMLYRSGDLARFTPEGEIEYLGRKDTQVKIRGFRLELGEIEAVAGTFPGLSGLVVEAKKLDEDEKELVLYYVPSPSADEPDPAALHAMLKDRLPAYMVPSYFERLDALPLLASGKPDRSKLPAPSSARLMVGGGTEVEPETELEADLARLLARVLKAETVSVEADFFADLGTNSLIMARYLGLVRKELGIKGASMRQIYMNPTIRALAGSMPVVVEAERSQGVELPFAKAVDRADTPAPAAFEGEPIGPPLFVPEIGEVEPIRTVGASSEPQHVATRFQHLLCGGIQAAYIVFSGFLIALFLDYGFRFMKDASSIGDLYLRAVEVSIVSFFGLSAALIAIKWLAIGRFKTGTIPLWSVMYARFWIAQSAIRTNPLNVFIGTPLYTFFLRLLGAKIGRGTLFYSRPPICTDLVTIGDNVLVRQDCRMPGYFAHRGLIHAGPITIGANTLICEATVFEIGSSIGANAQLGTTSSLMRDQTLPGGKRYQGVPAQETETNFIRVANGATPRWKANLFTFASLSSGLLIFTPISLLITYTILVLGFAESGVTEPGFQVAAVATYHLLGYAILVYFGGVVLSMIGATILPRIYNLFFHSNVEHSLFGFQYWLFNKISQNSNRPKLQEYFGDSSLITGYYRLLGYDLRNSTQTGSNFGVTQRQHSPFLVKFNRETLVSDGLYILNLDISCSSFKLSSIEMPADTYFGNSIHYPAGAKVGSNSLIATKAYVPIDGPIRENVGLLGSPVFEIPRTVSRDHRFDHFKSPGIFEKRLSMKLKSNLITLGLLLSRDITSVFFVMSLTALLLYEAQDTITASPLISVLVLTSIFVATTFFVPLWIILFERFATQKTPMKPRICSLYDRHFWDHERYWKLHYNPFLTVFDGTPFRPLFVRLQGVKVGKQVFDNGAGLQESLLTEIGDYACLNYNSILQGHSLEDGTFKCDAIKIGNRCTIGTNAFVHYGVEMGDDAVVETDAFVMKGSIIGDEEVWRGNPAQPLV